MRVLFILFSFIPLLGIGQKKGAGEFYFGPQGVLDTRGGQGSLLYGANVSFISRKESGGLGIGFAPTFNDFGNMIMPVFVDGRAALSKSIDFTLRPGYNIYRQTGIKGALYLGSGFVFRLPTKRKVGTYFHLLYNLYNYRIDIGNRKLNSNVHAINLSIGIRGR